MSCCNFFCICTKNIISLSFYLRQLRKHFTFHAGQNLAAKEFCYLIVLIVKTAANLSFNLNYFLLNVNKLKQYKINAGQVANTIQFKKKFAVFCVFVKQLFLKINLYFIYINYIFFTFSNSKKFCLVP